MTGFSLTLIPFSWHIGVWKREKKTLWALGPFRFVIHRLTGEWKS
jgi:hypothetical protein